MNYYVLKQIWNDWKNHPNIKQLELITAFQDLFIPVGESLVKSNYDYDIFKRYENYYLFDEYLLNEGDLSYIQNMKKIYLSTGRMEKLLGGLCQVADRALKEGLFIKKDWLVEPFNDFFYLKFLQRNGKGIPELGVIASDVYYPYWPTLSLYIRKLIKSKLELPTSIEQKTNEMYLNHVNTLIKKGFVRSLTNEEVSQYRLFTEYLFYEFLAHYRFGHILNPTVVFGGQEKQYDSLANMSVRNWEEKYRGTFQENVDNYCEVLEIACRYADRETLANIMSAPSLYRLEDIISPTMAKLSIPLSLKTQTLPVWLRRELRKMKSKK